MGPIDDHCGSHAVTYDPEPDRRSFIPLPTQPIPKRDLLARQLGARADRLR